MFKLYYGIVENNNDTEKLGRLQIRIIGLHSEKIDEIKTEHLPWSIPIFPLSSSNTGIGIFSIPENGSTVACFPLDDEYQRWCYFGTIPGLPREISNGLGFSDPDKKYPLEARINENDINRLAKNDKIDQTIVQIKNNEKITNIPIANLGIKGSDLSNFEEPVSSDEKVNQPDEEYKTNYPDNLVIETSPQDFKNGNIIELDSTESFPRITIWHKTGTYTSIHSNGQCITRIMSDNYKLVLENDVSYINKDNISTIWGDKRELIRSNFQKEVYGYERSYIKGNNIQYISGDVGIWIGSDLADNPSKPSYSIESKKLDGSIPSIEEKDVPDNTSIGGNLNLKIENNEHVEVKGNHYKTVNGTYYVNVTGERNYTKNKVGNSGDMTLEPEGRFILKGHKLSSIRGNLMSIEEGCVNGFSFCPYMLSPHSFKSRSVKSSI